MPLPMLNIPWLSDSLKKRALRYILQRYLGHFLEEKLTLDQMSVDLYDGKGCIRELNLDVEGLNEELLFLPFKFIEGCSIKEITCSVPWSALLTESCSLEIDGAALVCQVTGKGEEDKGLGDISMYLSKSMSTSMQMAEEIVHDQPVDEGKFDGLEMMAQLIDSVLRRVRLVATNISFTIKEMEGKTGIGIGSKETPASQVEFRIKYLRCEEEDPVGEKDNRLPPNAPGSIDKLLTFEGVEVYVDDTCICKLGGKHMIKIKANETKSDLQIYVGSPLFAVLRSDQLRKFIGVFCPPDERNLPPKLSGEKMMSSQDFARVERQLQQDNAKVFNPTTIHSNPLSSGQNTWASGGTSNCDTEAKFLPLKGILDEETESSPNLLQSPDASHFSCYIKIPGIWLCLLSEREDSPSLGVPLVDPSFPSINTFIDGVLGGKSHLRVLALPVQMDITYNGFSVICGDIMVSEQSTSGLKPILWSEDQSQVLSTPKYRCDIRGNNVYVEGTTVTCINIDPTLVERVEEYLFSEDKSSSSPLCYQVKSEKIIASLMFPVPDMRPEADRTCYSSQLRKESLEMAMTKFSLNTNTRAVDATFESLKGTLIDGDMSSPILEAHCNSVELIEVSIKRGPGAVMSNTLENVLGDALFEAEMEDSIYISNSAGHQTLDPFQVKRKVIKEQGDENEPVVCPSDRGHALEYLEQARGATQLQVEINVPGLDLKVNEKELELIYNRLGNDLVLWKPIKRKAQPEDVLSNNISPTSPPPPSYFACKSGLAESDSDSSFHSFDGSPSSKMQNMATCLVNVQELRAIFLHEECSQCISSQKVLLGLVLGLDNDTSNVVSLCLDKVNFVNNSETIIGGNKFTDSSSSLNLTFDIRLESEELKKIKFALQLSDAAMYQTDFDIFTRFWSIINLKDEEVLGYSPPSVLTELHVSLINGAIAIETPDTRPALFTFDDTYITSMVVENTSQTLLRIIIEEGSLFFSRGKKSTKALKDYVCVLESGLTDLNLKIKDDEKIEFKISNNVINVRTCSDSLNALCQLIQSVATPAAEASAQCPDTASNFSDNETSPPDGDLIQDAIDDIKERDAVSPESPGSTKLCECDGKGDVSDESGFWILGDDDVGAGIKMTSEPQIRVLSSDPIKVTENHFGMTRSRPLPEIQPATIERYLLDDMTIIFHFFGGRDFNDEEKESEKDVTEKELDSKCNDYFGNEPRVRFAEGTVHLWESLDLMSAPGAFKQSSPGSGATCASKAMGGRLRQTDVCVQLYLSKVKALYEKFDPTFSVAWRFIFMVNDIEIRDRVSASKINKMLYEYCSESMPRRNNANMISLKTTARRNASDNNEECDIKLSVKPLRVNIDQDTLMFLLDFFVNLNPTPCPSSSSPAAAASASDLGAKLSSFNVTDENVNVNNDLLIDKTDAESIKSDEISIDEASVGPVSSKPPSLYVKSFNFSPDVPIRLDYHGRFDFDQGALAGILMGLAQLNQTELRLKRLYNKHGMLGLDRVVLYAVNEWTRDIKRHQLPSLLGSVGPMHSVVQLFQGMRDLVWMPIDQYRKDRRLVRGIQRGASSFSSSTAMACIDLANRFVHLVQNTAQFAHDVVSTPTHSHRTHGHHNNHSAMLPSSQPRDLREGMTTAYTLMREGINDTVRTIGSAGMQAEDVRGAIGSVIRQLPSSLFRPIIQTSQATSNVLVGMRNQLTPEARKDDQDKWKNVAER